jgi:hypothetical protein
VAPALDASVSFDGLWLAGKRFAVPATLDQYVEVLGTPSKTIEAGPPAPWGHRNHQIHIFDDLGLYLNEHHVTALIGEVAFVLEPTGEPFPRRLGVHSRD